MLAVYHALAASPQWERTLLIVFYDEHGGFYDHVAPHQAPDDDPRMFGRYGVRVPTLIVSPWVEPRMISHTRCSTAPRSSRRSSCGLPWRPQPTRAARGAVRAAQQRRAPALPGNKSGAGP